MRARSLSENQVKPDKDLRRMIDAAIFEILEENDGLPY